MLCEMCTVQSLIVRRTVNEESLDRRLPQHYTEHKIPSKALNTQLLMQLCNNAAILATQYIAYR